jgi:hypothetical protein
MAGQHMFMTPEQQRTNDSIEDLRTKVYDYGVFLATSATYTEIAVGDILVERTDSNYPGSLCRASKLWRVTGINKKSYTCIACDQYGKDWLEPGKKQPKKLMYAYQEWAHGDEPWPAYTVVSKASVV